MALERTFGAGLLHEKEVPQTGQRTVGLFQDPDGSSWVREPDGTETRLPAGGGGGPPIGPAGGALAGTYPNPDLAAALAGAGLGFLANVVSVNVDGSTVEIVADIVRVKDGGITPVKLSFDPATQAELDAVAATVAALDAVAVKDGDAAGGDLAGTYPNPTLVAIGAATGPIGDATTVPVVTIDAKGRVTALTSATITGVAPGGAAGGVLSGNYPNPGFAVDMATQAELDAAIATAVRVADFDAKGDLLVGTANDAFDQLAAGADGTVLTTDSSAATGRKQALPPGYELGYAQVTANAVVTATVDPGDEIVNLGSIVYPNVPIIVQFYFPAINVSGAVTVAALNLVEGTGGGTTVLNIIGRWGAPPLVNAYETMGGVLSVRFTPSAGAHTYRVTGRRTGGTSFTLRASTFAVGANFAPIWMRAIVA